MINENPYGNISAPVGIASIITNIILLYLATKIKEPTRDLKLVMLIASIELLAPLVSISDIAATVMREEDAVNDPKLCQYLGLFTILLILCQFIVSAFLALERLNIVVKIRYMRYIFISGILSLAFHLMMTIYLAVSFEFLPQTAKLVCLIYPETSLISSIAFYHFITISFTSLIIIIACYIKLGYYLSDYTKFLTIDNAEPNFDGAKKIKRRASLRIYFTVSLYSICMFLGLFFYLIDSILNYLQIHSDLQYTFGTFATILIALGFLSNSILVLTTHTLINQELLLEWKKLCSKIISFFMNINN
ncbi:hypothetical protein K502DRAFT_348956 [Neoconidiobolus thromboides FSU 785]|nr:hypothetical protein K502DRAFT_348956 [Neoconidiobolus thromboides FSU 785]